MEVGQEKVVLDRVARPRRYLRHLSSDFWDDYGNFEAFDPLFPNSLAILCVFTPVCV